MDLTQIYTVEEYLEIERRSIDRLEYYNGKIQLLDGGTLAHNRVARNVLQQLCNALNDSNVCEPFGSNQKIYLPDYQYYVYPNVLVVTDGPVMTEEKDDALLNPLLVIEAPPSDTEKYDWNKRFTEYRTLPSFKEYVLIRQDTPHVISFFREAPDLWRESEVRGLDQEVLFKSIDVRLALELIYRKAEFINAR